MADLAEDLECLCQIMRTCGKVLDKPKAKVSFTASDKFGMCSSEASW